MDDAAADQVAKKDAMTDNIVAVLLIADALLLIATMVFSKSVLVAAATITASSGVGAVAGLLFGIPKRRVVAPTPKDDQGPARTLISANTSLEEVSDWLTKTIVGVGLVSWAALLRTLDDAGVRVGNALFGAGPSALPGGVAVLLASSSLAALAAYLWFSRYLPSEFDDAYRGINGSDDRGLKQQRKPVAHLSTFGSAWPDDSTGDGFHRHELRRLLVRGLVGGRGDDRDFEEGDDGGDEEQASTNEEKLKAAAARKYAKMQRAPVDIKDWAKGMFGGHSEVENHFGRRAISAQIKRSGRGLYEVEIIVTATPVPDTEVIFFLHDTFPNPTPSVSFNSSGTATLTVTAYGAFTVGALTDDGTTELELDLGQLSTAPKAFRDAD